MKIKTETMEAVIGQFAPMAERQDTAGNIARAVIGSILAGLSAIRQLAAIRQLITIEESEGQVNVDCVNPAAFLDLIREIEDLPFELPVITREQLLLDKFFFVAEKNPFGCSLEQLECVDCKAIPTATSRVWTFPSGDGKHAIVCEACAEQRVAKREALQAEPAKTESDGYEYEEDDDDPKAL